MLTSPVTHLATLLIGAVCWTSGVAPVEGGGTDAFAKACIVPPDVKLFLRASDATALRRAVASRPIGAALRASLVDSELRAAWSSLAEDLGRDEGELLDELFGRDVVLALRDAPDGRGLQWAIASAVDADDMARLLTPAKGAASRALADASRGATSNGKGRSSATGRGLGVRALGGGWREFVRQQVVATFQDGMLVVGPSGDPRLAEEIATLAVADGGPRLSNDTVLAEARALGGLGPRVELFVRSSPSDPTAWSAAVCEMRGRTLELRHISAIAPGDERGARLRWPFANSAMDVAAGVGTFGGSGTPGAADSSETAGTVSARIVTHSHDLLDRLREEAVVAFVEPLDDGEDAPAAMLAMAPDLFGAHRDDLRLLRKLADGPTMVVVAAPMVRPCDSPEGRADGGSHGGGRGLEQGPAARAGQTTPVALVTEIRNPLEAANIQDDALQRRIAAHDDETARPKAHDAPWARLRMPGSFPESKVADAAPKARDGQSDSQATAETAPLFMQILSTEGGRWKIVCNDAALLGRVVGELRDGRVAAGTPSGPIVRGAGVIDGRRLAAELRTAVPMVPAKLGAGFGVPFGSGQLVDWASCLETLRWVLTQPASSRLELRASAELADTTPDGR
ncbi:MAG: hypothetical protein U0575_07270 [Phycisphaerales bacterium]